MSVFIGVTIFSALFVYGVIATFLRAALINSGVGITKCYNYSRSYDDDTSNATALAFFWFCTFGVIVGLLLSKYFEAKRLIKEKEAQEIARIMETL